MRITLNGCQHCQRLGAKYAQCPSDFAGISGPSLFFFSSLFLYCEIKPVLFFFCCKSVQRVPQKPKLGKSSAHPPLPLKKRIIIHIRQATDCTCRSRRVLICFLIFTYLSTWTTGRNKKKKAKKVYKAKHCVRKQSAASNAGCINEGPTCDVHCHLTLAYFNVSDVHSLSTWIQHSITCIYRKSRPLGAIHRSPYSCYRQPLLNSDILFSHLLSHL